MELLKRKEVKNYSVDNNNAGQQTIIKRTNLDVHRVKFDVQDNTYTADLYFENNKLSIIRLGLSTTFFDANEHIISFLSTANLLSGETFVKVFFAASMEYISVIFCVDYYIEDISYIEKYFDKIIVDLNNAHSNYIKELNALLTKNKE